MLSNVGLEVVLGLGTRANLHGKVKDQSEQTLKWVSTNMIRSVSFHLLEPNSSQLPSLYDTSKDLRGVTEEERKVKTL